MTTAEDKIKRELETVFDDLILLAKKYPVLIHTFRYALGAVYALHQAIILEHKDRALYDDDAWRYIFHHAHWFDTRSDTEKKGIFMPRLTEHEHFTAIDNT